MTQRRYQDDDDYPEGETSTAGYWERKDRQMKADIAADRAYAQSLAGLEHRLSVIDTALVRENTIDLAAHEAEVADLKDRIAVMRAEARAVADTAQAAKDAEWTADVTAERRAAWNARVTAGEFTGRSGKVDFNKLRQAETSQGWTFEDLKRAIDRHKAAV